MVKSTNLTAMSSNCTIITS